MTAQLLARGKVLVGLGANCPGVWGTAANAIAQGLGEIERAHIAVLAVSPLYETAAAGSARQPSYVNAMALLDTRLPSEALLRVLKRIERRSGRRGGRPWGPRTLDIDIIDYKGLIRHWRDGRPDFVRAGPKAARAPPSADAGEAVRAETAARHRARLAPPGARREREKPVAQGRKPAPRPSYQTALMRVRLAMAERTA